MFSPIVFLTVLFGCSLSSLEDFRHEGEARCRALVEVLQQVQSPEDLLRAEGELKKHFESLVDLMIEAKRFQSDHDHEEPMTALSHVASEALREQLRRIYSLEGGRAGIERCQHEALVRLNKNCETVRR